ncbi:MAG: DUF2750 domain-containing protein [Roseivirga sp.]|jgi:hypothetical protein|uniref:DUF2750 domain-containing protein n=1 Tax=Roseivirga sp. TaxID=1964215 RepID=UPI001B229C0F|nr:DUF2750 domain-containing protein [Roseivirga sp.]MBO6495888.1 DUF2750 domain-containing protein [Roseivirga sp.]
MHSKQVENLLKLSNEERVDYLIRYCADWEEIWGLTLDDNNWVVIKDDEGDEIFPIWPSKCLAEHCMFQEHRDLNAKPSPINVYSFLDQFINDPDLEGVYFGVFYNTNREALVLQGALLKTELESELEQYE